jgi:hypothetical protein
LKNTLDDEKLKDKLSSEQDVTERRQTFGPAVTYCCARYSPYGYMIIDQNWGDNGFLELLKPNNRILLVLAILHAIAEARYINYIAWHECLILGSV